LQDTDTDVASAAAVALGRIGKRRRHQDASRVIAAAPAKVRPAVAEGCMLCASD